MSDALRRLAVTGGAIVSISLVVFAYERALIPIYASGPTSHGFTAILLTSFCIATLQPFAFTNSQKALTCGVLLAAAPKAAHWIAIWSARNKDPIWGPATTHTSVLLPLIIALSSMLTLPENPIARIAILSISYLLGKDVCKASAFLLSISESQIYLVLSFIYTFVSILYLNVPKPSLAKAAAKKKRKTASTSIYLTSTHFKYILSTVYFVLAFNAYPYLQSPVLPHPLQKPFTHPKFPLQIHSSVQSTTGLIVVGEALTPGHNATEREQRMSSVRYLRAAHSLLGGVWMGPKVMSIEGVPPITDSHGTNLGDSIYGAFTLQEAARLVNSTSKAPEKALIIGLGVGIAATAFRRHKLDVTIVEIDPAVYDAARRFFGLPDPGEGRVFLEDARGWARKRRAQLEAGDRIPLYDIAVHDCFSGGGVPEHIFTVEFWEDLKSTLSPEGVLVINYAGYLQSDPVRLVSSTLLRVFRQCTAFHDLLDPTPEALENDFLNVVFFCTPSPTPMTFRQSHSKDWLGSPLRRHVLSALQTREIDLRAILGSIPPGKEDQFILTDANNRLGQLEEAQADHHWMLMREVLPDIMWETY